MCQNSLCLGLHSSLFPSLKFYRKTQSSVCSLYATLKANYVILTLAAGMRRHISRDDAGQAAPSLLACEAA